MVMAWTHEQFCDSALFARATEAKKALSRFIPQQARQVAVAPGELLFNASFASEYDGGGHDTFYSAARWCDLGELTEEHCERLRAGCTVEVRGRSLVRGHEYAWVHRFKPIGTAADVLQSARAAQSAA
jgi:hypothetical protein